MSSFNRRMFLMLAAPLAACTFTPAYAPGGAASRLFNQVRVDDPSGKDAFDLVERLEERLGRPQTTRYALSYAIRTTPAGIGITPENAITRYNLTGAVDWTLSDITTGARLSGGTVQSFTSYAATGSTVAGLAAEEDAAYRLMRLLADQIVTRLIATSASFP